jgi:hypothetical protein
VEHPQHTLAAVAAAQVVDRLELAVQVAVVQEVLQA